MHCGSLALTVKSSLIQEPVICQIPPYLDERGQNAKRLWLSPRRTIASPRPERESFCRTPNEGKGCFLEFQTVRLYDRHGKQRPNRFLVDLRGTLPGAIPVSGSTSSGFPS
jgi:hypothetical protein